MTVMQRLFDTLENELKDCHLPIGAQWTLRQSLTTR